MKTIITTIAAALFTTGAMAANVYHGLDEGNPDLSTARPSAEDFAGVQPSIGDRVDRYHGLAEGNPDLFSSRSNETSPKSTAPDIYQNLRGNPDLRF